MSTTEAAPDQDRPHRPARARSGVRTMLAIGSIALVAIGGWVGYEALRGPSSPVLAATVVDGRPVLLVDLCGMRLDHAGLTAERLRADVAGPADSEPSLGDLGPLVADPTSSTDERWTRFDLAHVGEQVDRTAEPDGAIVHHLHAHLATTSRTAEHRTSVVLPAAPWPEFPAALPVGGGDPVDRSELPRC